LLYSNSGASVPFISRSKSIEGKEKTRERAVFIEKGYGSLFGFCETSPCLTQTTGDVSADIAGLTPDQFIKELILKSYTLLNVQRSGAEIVKASADCIDPNQRTNPVQLQFASWDDGEIDFIYDAKENKAYARDKGKDLFWNYLDVYNRWEVEDKVVFDDVKENWEYYDVIIPILNAKTFENFYNSIAQKTNDYADIYLIDGKTTLEKTDSEFVKSKITKNRPDYITSWINPGKCKVSTAVYDCYIFGNTQGKCNLENSGNICIVGAEKQCGKTCFCPTDYLEGDIFGFSVGDQKWEFKIAANNEIVKGCTYNCPVK
jgi:hypothetical protein